MTQQWDEGDSIIINYPLGGGLANLLLQDLALH